MMDGCTIPLTWAARHTATRAALAGMEITTPLELYIFMGGDPDVVTERELKEAQADLRAHGYRPEMVPVRFYGPLQERWVRREHWPEDDQWPA